jgi:putative membrane protein
VTLFFKKEVLIILSASSLMLVYDLFLEQVAPKMDMWSFKNLNVPLDNYIAWFIFASLFIALLRIVKVNTKNPIAPFLFFAQLIFFIFLSFFL